MDPSEMELASKALEEIGETGRTMIAHVAASTAASEASGIIADTIRFQRIKRQIRMVQKAAALLDDAGLPPRVIPPTVLAPLLLWAELEDDATLSETWAKLLASAGCASSPTFHRSFPEALRQLERTEAMIIDGMFFAYCDGEVTRPATELLDTTPDWTSSSRLADFMSADFVEIRARNLDNLERLRLCETRRPANYLGHARRRHTPPRDGGDAQTQEEVAIKLTSYGIAFAVACQAPSAFPPRRKGGL